MSKTKVFMRETKKYKTVSFRFIDDEDIQNEMIEKWQNIIDIAAKTLHVKAGLIMRITKENMEVFLKSNTKENPYPENGKDTLGHGLYCETVIASDDKLYVKNALNDDDWKDNPDVTIGMISYLGYPIKYPNGEFFGTICALDDKEMILDENEFKFLTILRDSIEKDLILAQKIKEIRELSYIDYLTGIYNRRYMKEKIDECQEIISRSDNSFLLTSIDLNNFKHVNDSFGHSTGDEVLQIFSSLLKKRLRKIDYFGRIGGDEFLIISLNTSVTDFKTVIDTLHRSFLSLELISKTTVSFAYGSCEANKDMSVRDAYIKADQLMYIDKKNWLSTQ